MKYFFLASICFFNFSAFSQSSAELIEEKFNSFTAANQTEKVYLHLNKSFFSAGEDLWFKAYVTTGPFHSPGSLGNVLNVLITDPQGQEVARRAILLKNGTGKGDFHLSDTLGAGEYHIQAYTQYMRNYSPDFFFSRKIKVIAPAPFQYSNEHTTDQDQVTLNFFPEGGQFVAGHNNRLAFKAENRFGDPVDFKGVIVSQQGDTISSIKPYKFGLGELSFYPKLSEAPYTAHITCNDKTLTFQLPKPQKQGFIFHLNNLPDKIHLKAEGIDSITGGNAFVVAHLRGKHLFTIKAQKGNKIYTSIPKQELPSGIIHFTLFDGNGKPQSERLTFVENSIDRLKLVINSNKLIYTSREQANIQMALTSQAGLKQAANASVSIIDKKAYDSLQHKGHIKSYFLLESDLKGKIPRPDYYFDSLNQDRHYLLDLLMLTHGWRRFSWENILADSVPHHKFQPQIGFTVSGKIKNPVFKHGTSGLVTLSLKEDPLFSIKDTTSSDGHFKFENLHFIDTAQIILQAKKLSRQDKNKNGFYEISVIDEDRYTPPAVQLMHQQDSTKSETQASTYLAKAKKIKNIEEAFSSDKDAIILNEVAVEAKKENVFDKIKPIYHHPDRRIVPDSIIGRGGLTNALELLQGRVAGVRVIPSHFGRKTALLRGQTPLFLLDGMVIGSDALNVISPHDIAFIDILKGASAAIYGSRGRGGVIAFYTKRAAGIENYRRTEVPGIFTFNHPGYYAAREFYAPNHEKKENPQAKPDFRHTLFWNPDVQFNADGQAAFQFHTSDEQADYIIVVEGITPKGGIILGNSIITVDNKASMNP